ncbi:hypothetical protein [Marinococcus luteus]|nr:hypothetical protein [Marinococcus luteus]
MNRINHDRKVITHRSILQKVVLLVNNYFRLEKYSSYFFYHT